MNKINQDQLTTQVLRQFRIIIGSVRQHFREIEQTFGVSGSQLWILREVSQTPYWGVTQIAERLSIHPSTCSQLVEKLVGRGLIIKVRSSEDQRRVGLLVTKEAEKMLTSVPGPSEGILPDAISSLSLLSLVSLEHTLTELIEKLQIKDEKHAGEPLSEL